MTWNGFRRPIRLGYRLALAALVSLPGFSVLPETTVSESEGMVGFKLQLARGGGEDPESLDRLTELLAREALPVRVRLEAGQTLREAIFQTCGSQPRPGYVETVQERFADLNPSASLRPVDVTGPEEQEDGSGVLGLRASKAEEVVLPFCLNTRGQALPDQLMRELSGRSPSRTRRPSSSGIGGFAVAPPMPGPESHQYAYGIGGGSPVSHVEERTRPAWNWTSPTVPVAANVAERVAVEAARIGAASLPSPPSPGRLDELLSSDQLPDDTCRSEGEPFDLVAVLSQLAENQELRRHYPRRLPEASSPTVLAADTGLPGMDELKGLPLLEQAVRRDGTPEGERYRLADDRYKKHRHGVNVATMALGGVDFLPLNRLLPAPVRLDAYSLVQALGDDTNAFFYFPLDRIDAVSAYSGRLGGAIVNLSVRYEEKLPRLKDSLSSTSPSLYVVAAGNDSSDMNQEEWYPGRYGGHLTDNLITVAALDGDSLASFSNRSERYVDLAAPGCRLPVLDVAPVRGVVVRRSGTSLAAPVVAFAAAMIRREIPSLTGNELKRRLLYSARLNPTLREEKQVKDGRTLDLEAALAVFTDLVILDDGRRLRGRVDFTLSHGEGAQQVVDFCDGARELKRSALRRVATVAGGVEVHWEDGDRNAERSLCPWLAGEVRLRDPFTSAVNRIQNSKVADVIFATLPYWQD